MRQPLLLLLIATCPWLGCAVGPHGTKERATAAADGSVRTEVTWSNGVRNGAARLLLPDGSTKEGRYVDGLKEGTWVRRNAAGDTVGTAAYVSGKLHGWLVERKKNVVVREALYAQGVANGPRITRHASGHPTSLDWFEDGKEQGPAWRWNLRDSANVGKRTVGWYEEGLAQGTWRRYYANGMLNVENDYVNGVRHGTSKLWGPDGTLLRHLEYRNDGVVRTIVDRLGNN